jgi:beta-glucanase (GH16 family)
LAAVAILLLLCATTFAQDKGKLVWSDEFDYTGAPDPKRWTNEVGFIRNRESQFYAAGRLENARVENGRLIIEARKEQFAIPPGTRGVRGRTNASYTSASLTTRRLGEWKHVRIEVRAKLPRGRGVWPAIWLLGTNYAKVGWPRCGEIDMMEYVGFDTNTIHANIHTGKYNHMRGTGKGSTLRVASPFDDFHVYVLDWQADRMDFFVDDKRYFTYAKELNAADDVWPFDQPFYLILNLAIGGTWGGEKGVDETIFPQRYEIDYVRVYQR